MKILKTTGYQLYFCDKQVLKRFLITEAFVSVLSVSKIRIIIFLFWNFPVRTDTFTSFKYSDALVAVSMEIL